MKLTLLRKGVLLVSIPLCFEVLIFGWLINIQDNLEREAQRINHNKQINDLVNLILRDTVLINNALALNYTHSLTGFNSKEIQARVTDIRQNFLDLEVLAHDDPVVLGSVGKCEAGLALAFQDISRLKEGLHTAKSVKELQHLISATRSSLEKHLYITLRGGMFELALEAMHGSDDKVTEKIEGQKKLLLQCALGLSALIAVLGTYILSTTLVRRLTLVNQNAERLGKGQPLLPPFGGNDEVADLDRSFHHAAELIEAAKKMRQEVTAMITHDLKSPLQSVRSYLEMLENSRFGTLNQPGLRLLPKAQNASNQMGVLIDNVLQLEKLRSGVVRLQTSAIDLPQLLNQCLDGLSLLAEHKQVVFARDYASAGCDTISGDAFWLEQVFVNLLSNAIKFTATGSTVSVGTKGRTPGTVEVRITDQGPGIADEEMKLIFDRFHRVQSTGDVAGTGLGLPIAKELIELHHGAISVESEIGKGSTFILSLVVDGADSAAVPSQLPAHDQSKQSLDRERNNKVASDEHDGQPNLGANDNSADDQFGSRPIDQIETKNSIDEDDQGREFANRLKGGNGGWFRLRLLHKGLVLISIPLCFEVMIFGYLMNLQAKLELEAQRISDFKKFNDNANVVLRDLVSLALTSRRQKMRAFVFNANVYILAAEMNRAFEECKRLATSPSELQGAQEVQDGVGLLLADIIKRKQQYQDGTYKRGENSEGDLGSQLNRTFTTAALRLGYRSVSPKYALHSTELREHSRGVLNYALAFSVLFAVTAAFSYRNNLVGRLNQVSENTNRLAKGEPLLEQVGGSDEIAELDATVHYAAGMIEAAKKMRQEATAMITHDLKTPLQSVRNYFEMLEMGNFGNLNEKGTRLLAIGMRSLQHMADLINGVLQLEKLRTGNVTLQAVPLRLSGTLDTCLDAVKLLAGQKNISIVRGYDQSDSALIDGDAFWLQQVFGNVLSNAIKFSPENSTVFIGLMRRETGLEVQIQDQGPGIPEKDLAQIFDRYHRVESTAAVPGTGLGLPIAKELIELHHGSITVESKPGSGCTFSIVLPFAQIGDSGSLASQ